LRLWATVGVRNKRQRNQPAEATARENVAFLRTETNYLTTREIKRHFSRYFACVEFVEGEFLAATRHGSWVSRVSAPISGFGPTNALYRGLNRHVVLAHKRSEREID
jgi:hypothetical protein